MAASEVTASKLNFLGTVGTSEAETSVGEKTECLLTRGQDKKRKLLGITFFFKDCAIFSYCWDKKVWRVEPMLDPPQMMLLAFHNRKWQLLPCNYYRLFLSLNLISPL